MTVRRLACAFAATVGLALTPHAAQADMGTAPVGPQGIYLSFEGGYLHHDTDGVTGHGIVLTPGGPTRDVEVSPDDGYFLAGLIGFENGTPFFFGFHRIELFFLFGDLDGDTVSHTAPPLDDVALTSVDGTILVTGGGQFGRTTVERRTWEAALRFEDDDVINATTTVTWVFAPFIRNFDESVDSIVGGTLCGGSVCAARRSGDVDSFLLGFYVAAEPEMWLTPALALVGRLGAGVYHYDADGKFRSSSNPLFPPDTFAANISDDDSGLGFRGLLGIGLKFKLTSTMHLEGFGEADYFSKVGGIHMTSNTGTGFVSHVEDDSLWEFRTGLRLTIGFGPAPN